MSTAKISKYRYSAIILKEFVVTDFKLRYQGSALGYLWTLLRPLLLFVILYIVFGNFLRLGDSIPNYPVYLLTGIVLWSFFAEITNNGVQAIVSKSDLIRKISFPRYVIILATSFSALINLALNTIIIMFFILLSGVEIQPFIVFVPIFVIELFVFAVALAFILSALFVRYRDFNYIWEVIMQAMFYAVPIIYPIQLVLEKWEIVGTLLLINPVAQVIQDVRYLAITQETETLLGLSNYLIYSIPFIIVLITSIFAVWFFKKRAPYFAEEV